MDNANGGESSPAQSGSAAKKAQSDLQNRIEELESKVRQEAEKRTEETERRIVALDAELQRLDTGAAEQERRVDGVESIALPELKRLVHEKHDAQLAELFEWKGYISERVGGDGKSPAKDSEDANEAAAPSSELSSANTNDLSQLEEALATLARRVDVVQHDFNSQDSKLHILPDKVDVLSRKLDFLSDREDERNIGDVKNMEVGRRGLVSLL